MPALTVQQVTLTGLEITMVAADVGGDTFVNNGTDTILYIDNGSGGDLTLTVDGIGTAPTGAVAFDDDIDIIITAGEFRHIGPFPKSRFASVVNLAYSGIGSLTVGVIRL